MDEPITHNDAPEGRHALKLLILPFVIVPHLLILACSHTSNDGTLANGGASTGPAIMAGSGGLPGSGGSGQTASTRGVATGSGGANVAAGAAGRGSEMDATSSTAIDFTIWSLQLPIGSGTSPTIIPPSQLVAGFSDAYFYPAPDGGQIFMDPATGITTSGSQHCRTELREMTSSGTQAAWTAAGTNTLTVSGKVLQVGGDTSGHTAVGQVYNDTDSIPLCELEYSSQIGGFELLYEETKGAGTTVDLETQVALDEPYTYALALTGGTLTVTINGNEVYTHTPSAQVAANAFYFKCGNYDQTATAGAVSTTPYSVVEINAITVVHQ
jgi:hypothetical protein